MKRSTILPLVATLALALLGSAISCRASDHADPLVLNPLNPPKQREPRITDLHAFLDKDQDPSLPQATALVLSFCVFPSLPALVPAKPGDNAADTITVERMKDLQPPATGQYRIPKLALDGYTYRIFLDLNARLTFDHPGDLARYGGTVVDPADISPEVTFEFELKNDGTIKRYSISGLSKTGSPVRVQAGIFDDPFIFPRFFRTNVVGIVVSIPLDRFPASQRNFLIWAIASKDGKQIDHVGRSQRTQLPRFDYLNPLPPSEHVAAINRHHVSPDIAWDFMRTFFSPLFGRRLYDAAPDVMIYSFDRPTLFPNGRKLADDVAAIIKETGDTQLWEVSYTEDPRFPRITMNDGEYMDMNGQRVQAPLKKYGAKFPYLAPPWTTDAVKKHPLPFTLGRPDLSTSTWRTLWLLELSGVFVLLVTLFFVLESKVARWSLLLVAVAAIALLHPLAVPADPAIMGQPALKLSRLILGGGLIVLLFLGFVFFLGRRSRGKSLTPEPFPPGNQGVTDEDRPMATHSFDDVKKVVFTNPYYGPVWDGPERRALPIYRQTVASLLLGLIPIGSRLFLQAAKRTVRSRADLRWGGDGKGFRRLLHPMGVCLTGTWKITDAPAGTNYTGYFAKGAQGRVVARYSTGGSQPRGGHYRSLALVGKIYPQGSEAEIPAEGPAHFITQEDLGSTRTDSIRDAVLTNSPPVSPWNRGKEVVFLFINGLTLLAADTKNSERQLYEVAELGNGKGARISCPRFMRLTLSDATPRFDQKGADFREEILDIIYDRGDPKPKRKLNFDIAVSDTGRKWALGIEFITGLNWTTIGQIAFDEAAASYNGDFVIHFHHPVWRNDRNDPTTVKRPDLR